MTDSPTAYIIDTCSLTKLRRDYPRDVLPSLWEFLGGLIAADTVQSIELVYDELAVQSDIVKDWVDERKEMFLPLTPDIQAKASAILSVFPSLVDLKKRKSGADPFVIAAADVTQRKVVTEEKKSNSPRPKIPDVCTHYNITCMRLIELLQAEGLRL